MSHDNASALCLVSRWNSQQVLRTLTALLQDYYNNYDHMLHMHAVSMHVVAVGMCKLKNNVPLCLEGVVARNTYIWKLTIFLELWLLQSITTL